MPFYDIYDEKNDKLFLTFSKTTFRVREVRRVSHECEFSTRERYVRCVDCVGYGESVGCGNLSGVGSR